MHRHPECGAQSLLVIHQSIEQPPELTLFVCVAVPRQHASTERQRASNASGFRNKGGSTQQPLKGDCPCSGRFGCHDVRAQRHMAHHIFTTVRGGRVVLKVHTSHVEAASVPLERARYHYVSKTAHASRTADAQTKKQRRDDLRALRKATAVALREMMGITKDIGQVAKNTKISSIVGSSVSAVAGILIFFRRPGPSLWPVSLRAAAP